MPSLLNPWVILFFLVSLFGAFTYGKHIEGAERDAAQLKAVTKAIEDAKAQAKIDFDLESKVEKDKQEARIKEAERNVKIVKEIRTDKVYVNADCNIPDAGLRLWNSAADGTKASGSPDDKVPGETPKAD